MSKGRGLSGSGQVSRFRVLVLESLLALMLVNLAFQGSDTTVVLAQDDAREATEQELNQPSAITINSVGNASPYPSNLTFSEAESPTVDTFSFSNPSPINIPNLGNATPYPSIINVSVPGSRINRITVTLRALVNGRADDLDIYLVGPSGVGTMLMSDAGGTGFNDQTFFIFDQTSLGLISDNGPLPSGTGNIIPSRPVNYEIFNADVFDPPGPGAGVDFPANLDVFLGTNPNGQWRLLVVDDTPGDNGIFAGGWDLAFQTEDRIVNSANDVVDGSGCTVAHCSLREAVASAPDGGTITFSSLFDTPQTINLVTDGISLSRSMTIQGKGAHLLTVRGENGQSGLGVFQLLTNSASADLRLSGMTITNGTGSPSLGGGILALSANYPVVEANLFLDRVNVTGNVTEAAGVGVYLAGGSGLFTNSSFTGNTDLLPGTVNSSVIFFDGAGPETLRLVNCTISGNTAGGISFKKIAFGGDSSELQIVNSTIANNNSGSSGYGGVTVETNLPSATATIRNSIIANNFPVNFQTRGSGQPGFFSQGFNLSDNFQGIQAFNGDTTANPRLGALAFNGGTTPNHALLAGSPALDRGNNAGSGQTTDQRGLTRTVGLIVPNAPGSDGTDIGAFEAQTLPQCTSSTAIATGQTLNGSLLLGDCHIEVDGSYYDAYTFTGTEGQQVAVSMDSPNFDTYVYLYQGSYPGGTYITEDDNGGGGTNARIPPGTGFRTLPATGTYTILATSLSPGMTGSYTLSLVNGPSHTVLFGYSNTGFITINDSPSPPTLASPYPSSITISGAPTSLSNLRVTLTGLTHTLPDDIDIILVGPQGQRSILMSDAGGTADVTLLGPIAFDQTAATAIPDSSLTAGLFRPANYGAVSDTFPSPGPGELNNAPASLGVFEGTNPNGTWGLYVVDDEGVDSGFISQGWNIRFNGQVVTVNKTADTNDSVCSAEDCSLREAIAAAAPGDTVVFSPLFNTPNTISLALGELAINKNLSIQGPGANLLTVSGNNSSRVFNINGSFAVNFGGLTIVGGNNSAIGNANGSTLTLNSCAVTGSTGLFAGGIDNASATLNILSSTISGNTGNGSGAAGGISNLAGTTTIINSTVSGNTANNGTGNGGGLRNSGNGTLTINNSTVTNNASSGEAASGGGIFRNTGTVTLASTIVAANQNNTTQPDITASGNSGVISNGFNLIGNRGGLNFNQTGDQSGTGASPLNPLLGALQNNGGATSTNGLLAGSPALDKGNSSGSTTDQRGLARPVDLAGITNISDASDIGAFEAQTAPVAQNRAPFDYDGDNKTDISIFRPGPGEWWVLRSSNGSNFALQFGNSTDKLVPADYTGDGKADVAFWRPLNGNWFVLRSEDSTFFAFPFGANGDVPVPGDFDGDNKADAAVFRPSSLNWFILKSTGGTDIVTFGAAGDKPVIADYDGDAKADIAIYRPVGGSGSEWWVRRSSNGSTFALQFGSSTDRPVPGDFTGDGKADVAFWRPSNGTWFVLRSEDSSFFAFPFGTNGDVPLQGDYDGDGKTDAGVFRPSSLNWFVQRSTAGTLIQTFGIAGDIPTPSAYVP